MRRAEEGMLMLMLMLMYFTSRGKGYQDGYPVKAHCRLSKGVSDEERK